LPSRTANVIQLNSMLRDQLDQAHAINQKLTEDLRRSATELQQVRDDFTQKARHWKEEERVS
jgi:DNA anti-recombination protein RmuC